MSNEKDKDKKELTTIEKLENKVTSPETIDYLAGKLEEHNLKGIKFGVEEGKSRIHLSMWKDSDNKRWEKIEINKNQIENKQVNLQGEQEEQTLSEIAEIILTNKDNNNNSNNGNDNNEGFGD